MLKNTESSYGSLAKWLHWIVALCFLITYVTIYARHWFMNEEQWFYLPVLRVHAAVGLSMLVWVVLRILWTLNNPHPTLPSMPSWQVISSRAMHWVLYFFMIAMPVSGYMGFTIGTHFGFFKIPTFRRTEMGQWLLTTFNTDWESWEAGWDFFHQDIAGAALLWIMIVIHAGAALYHHFVQKDAVLVRMLPGKKARAEELRRSAL